MELLKNKTVVNTLIVTILVLAGSYLSCKLLSGQYAISESDAQAFFITVATITIPFLWNAHLKVGGYRDQILVGGYKSILARKYFNVLTAYFNGLILLPTITFLIGGILTWGIIIVHPSIAYGFFAVLAPFVLTLHIWFELIENRVTSGLMDFIKNLSLTNKEDLLVFNEVWKIKDSDLRTSENIRTEEVVEHFLTKIPALIGSDKALSALLIQNFTLSLDKRDQILIFTYDRLLNAVLDWKKMVWEGRNNDQNYHLRYVIDELLTTLRKYAFSEEHYQWGYFERLRKHVEVNLKSENAEYIEDLLTDEIGSIFAEIKNESKTFFGLDNNFPNEWRVTSDIEGSVNDLPRRVVLNQALRLIAEAVFESKKLDFTTDRVLRIAFSGVEPMILGEILTYVYLPTTPDQSKLDRYLSSPKILGLIGSSFGGSFNSEEEFDNSWKKAFQTSQVSTFILASKLFNSTFSPEELSSLETEIGKLSENDLNSNQKAKLQQLKIIVNGIKDIRGQNDGSSRKK